MFRVCLPLSWPRWLSLLYHAPSILVWFGLQMLLVWGRSSVLPWNDISGQSTRFFWESVSCSQDWPQIHYIAKGDLKPQDFQPLLSKCPDNRHVPPHLCSTGEETLGLVLRSTLPTKWHPCSGLLTLYDLGWLLVRRNMCAYQWRTLGSVTEAARIGMVLKVKQPALRLGNCCWLCLLS